ncbi:MAG TPA: 2-hydroxychromene-2-carboxylate isomerase [Steroidobacteraceae bacterium]|nr:2-hydroxychromene-2-carboxylate isomerase [Steroidobacteraceae bacterium]
MKVTWIFDVISPFAYLNFKQLPQLPGPVEVEHMPVLFAGLLNHFGQKGPAEIDSKRRFTYRFALWRARKMGISMRMPPNHPFNPIMALRLIIAAGCTRPAIERVLDAVFLHGKDVADSGVIAELAHALGVADPAAALQAPAVKQKLRDNTDWAIQRGAFGVPSLIIDDEIFWGHDAFEMAADFIRDRAQFDDADMRAIDALPVGVTRIR